MKTAKPWRLYKFLQVTKTRKVNTFIVVVAKRADQAWRELAQYYTVDWAKDNFDLLESTPIGVRRVWRKSSKRPGKLELPQIHISGGKGLSVVMI